MPQPQQKKSYWNLVIFLIIVLAIAAGLYYYWITAEKKSETNQNVVVYTNQNKNLNLNVNNINKESLKTYKNSDYNFQIQYPVSWEIKETSTGEGEDKIFSISLGDSASLSIMSDSMEGIVKNSISINSEKEMKINGLESTKLEGGSAKDGSLVNIILIKKEGKLYTLRGYGQEFEQMVDSFKLL